MLLGVKPRGRLRINGAKLYNYDTVIALRKKDGTVAVNNNYYSQTTSRHQNYLKALLWGTDYKEASEISIKKMLEEEGGQSESSGESI